MKYFIYNDPDWTYQNYDFDNLLKIRSESLKRSMRRTMICHHFRGGEKQ